MHAGKRIPERKYKEDRKLRELMDFVKELSFVRVGGSAEEKRAAELIMGEVNRAAEEEIGRAHV